MKKYSWFPACVVEMEYSIFTGLPKKKDTLTQKKKPAKYAANRSCVSMTKIL
jgi:hypothetical protein